MQSHAVVLVVTSLRGGGAESVGVAWANALSAAGHSVQVVTLSDPAGAARLSSSVDLVDASRHSHLGRVRQIAREARASSATAVVALQSYPNLLALAARLFSRGRWATVVSEHNLISLGLPGSSFGHRLKIWIAKRTYRFADHVVACSHPVGAEMVSAFGARRGRYSIVLNPALSGSERTPAKRHDRSDRIDVLLIGRIAEQSAPARPSTSSRA